MHDYDNYRYYANGKIYKLTETENELLFMKIAHVYLTKEQRNYYLDLLN